MPPLAQPGNNQRSPPRGFAVRMVLTLSLGLTLGFLSGCASTPQASAERDAEARQFSNHPGSATLYVYRPYFDSPDSDTVLWINGKLIGATLPQTYFRVNLNPGKHTLSGMGDDNGQITIETRPGELYFVAISVSSGHTHYWQMPADIGRQTIDRCCALLENWAPGQRPLLR